MSRDHDHLLTRIFEEQKIETPAFGMGWLVMNGDNCMTGKSLSVLKKIHAPGPLKQFDCHDESTLDALSGQDDETLNPFGQAQNEMDEDFSEFEDGDEAQEPVLHRFAARRWSAAQPIDLKGIATNSIATNPLNESASRHQEMSAIHPPGCCLQLFALVAPWRQRGLNDAFMPIAALIHPGVFPCSIRMA